MTLELDPLLIWFAGLAALGFLATAATEQRGWLVLVWIAVIGAVATLAITNLDDWWCRELRPLCDGANNIHIERRG